MAFVVETGSGLIDANSYISLSDASSYVADHGNSSTWSAAADASKEEALRLGTQYIDLKYGNRYIGRKATRDQALCWPRLTVVDADGYSYDSNEIPNCLKQATVEAALRVIEGDDLLGVVENPGTIKREKTALPGPLSEEIEYVGGKSQVPYYPKIGALLRPIIKSSNMMSRG